MPPFDSINIGAKLVIVGITPGEVQALNALNEAARCLQAGLSLVDTHRKVKSHASFSGPLRSNLIAMLDHIGLHKMLGIDSCGNMFDQHQEQELVHYTSALRYPVLKMKWSHWQSLF